jgi:hypothetical protein
MAELVITGHRADGTIWCNLCGLLYEKKPLPCDHSLENEHLRSHQA